MSFLPYTYDSTIDEIFPFSQNEAVRKNIGSVYEIDNLAVVKEYRRKESLEKVLYTIAEYAGINQVNKYIAVLDILLSRTFRFSYPFSMDALQRKIHYKNTVLVPVL